MRPADGDEPVSVSMFLITWVVMMAAMTLPGITPFTVGISRLMRVQPAGHGTVAALTADYLVVSRAALLIGFGVVLLALPAAV